MRLKLTAGDVLAIRQSVGALLGLCRSLACQCLKRALRLQRCCRLRKGPSKRLAPQSFLGMPSTSNRPGGLGGVTLVAANICDTTTFDVQPADRCRDPPISDALTCSVTDLNWLWSSHLAFQVLDIWVLGESFAF